ncbi:MULTISPECIES: aquaporin [unclassified Streptomyces]|uniref:aquaporin n=1 Tax=unclassified Streptomyces TaxID=2593676 RepID=UPI0013A6A8E7|nr:MULTISPECIES: aquaporin [unclassified Streptomyces]
MPAPDLSAVAVFALEVHPEYVRPMPYAVAAAVGVIIALLGPVSGGAANPARQFGPALVSGNTIALWA